MASPNDQPEIIYSMLKVSKTYGSKTVIKDISLSYFHGAKIGVLGLNGSGKSTLLRIMAGIDENFAGRVQLSKGYTVGYLEQEPDLDDTKTVMEIVEEGMGEKVQWVKEYNAINDAFADPDADFDKLMAQQAKLQDLIENNNCWDLESQLEMAMDALRCPPADAVIGVLSGGERRRVALCRLLLQKPDILLLDEPTNHLDAETVAWLELHLQRYEGTVIAVTHDRYFLDNVAGWILELDRGEGIPWKGNYSSWLEQKSNRLAQQEKSDNRRQKTLERELEWMKMSPKGQHAKSKSRISSYESLLDEDSAAKDQKLELFVPNGPRLGSVVADFQGISKSYGDNLLFEDLSFSIPAGGILGVIGANGAGKTTMFKILTGTETPDSGTVKVGETVKFSHVDQMRGGLDQDESVFQNVADGKELINLGGKEVNARAWLSKFGFAGDGQSKKVKELSGGQQNRLNLAMVLKDGGNVLLLDEPTNDLDVNTLRSLEDAIESFAGSVVVISHDRWFLDRLATHILAFEGESNVVFYDGNYTQYEENRKERMGVDADTPTRIKYRHLTR